MFTESYFPLYSRSKAARGSSLVEKPTNPTSVFLNLKSSIDTPQGSEKCCSLFSSWLSTPSTFWSVSFLFPFHPALAVPGSANTEWTIYRSHPALQCVCTLLIHCSPVSPVTYVMNFNISNFFFHKQSFFLSWMHKDWHVQCFLWGLNLFTNEKQSYKGTQHLLMNENMSNMNTSDVVCYHNVYPHSNSKVCSGC